MNVFAELRRSILSRPGDALGEPVAPRPAGTCQRVDILRSVRFERPQQRAGGLCETVGVVGQGMVYDGFAFPLAPCKRRRRREREALRVQLRRVRVACGSVWRRSIEREGGGRHAGSLPEPHENGRFAAPRSVAEVAPYWYRLWKYLRMSAWYQSNMPPTL